MSFLELISLPFSIFQKKSFFLAAILSVSGVKGIKTKNLIHFFAYPSIQVQIGSGYCPVKLAPSPTYPPMKPLKEIIKMAGPDSYCTNNRDDFTEVN